MSGGSMDCIYSQLQEYAWLLNDPELVELAMDFSEVLHDCEWMHSADISEGEYNKTVSEFKRKWFVDANDRREEIIVEKVNALKNELLAMIGKAKYCKDCKRFKPGNVSEYGSCENCEGYLTHGYSFACDKLEV